MIDSFQQMTAGITDLGLNPDPPLALHRWAYHYADAENEGGGGWRSVNVWIPDKFLIGRAGPVANYLAEHLGWRVARSSWSCSSYAQSSARGLCLARVRVAKRSLLSRDMAGVNGAASETGMAMPVRGDDHHGNRTGT